MQGVTATIDESQRSRSTDSDSDSDVLKKAEGALEKMREEAIQLIE